MDDHIEKPAVEARQAVKLGVMRYVLGVSLALVVVAFLLVYVLGGKSG